MKNKVIGLLLLLHPFIFWSIFFKFNLEFSWFLKESYKFYDLLYSAVSFTAFSLGVWLLTSKARFYIILIFWIFFAFYQTAIWGFSNNRYLSKVELGSDVSLALIRYDFGAVSSNNFVKLEKFERRFLFFVVRKELRQFSDVKKGSVNLSEDSITVEITSYDNNKTVESIEFNGI